MRSTQEEEVSDERDVRGGGLVLTDLPNMEPCHDCGAPTLPAGTCTVCPNCGSTSGCS